MYTMFVRTVLMDCGKCICRLTCETEASLADLYLNCIDIPET